MKPKVTVGNTSPVFLIFGLLAQLEVVQHILQYFTTSSDLVDHAKVRS